MTTVTCRGAAIGNDIQIGTALTNVASSVSETEGGVSLIVSAIMGQLPEEAITRNVSESHYYITLRTTVTYNHPYDIVWLETFTSDLSRLLLGTWKGKILSQTVIDSKDVERNIDWFTMNDSSILGLRQPGAIHNVFKDDTFIVVIGVESCQLPEWALPITNCVISGCGGVSGGKNQCTNLRMDVFGIRQEYPGYQNDEPIDIIVYYPPQLQINNRVLVSCIPQITLDQAVVVKINIDNQGSTATAFQLDLSKFSACSFFLKNDRFQISNGNILELRPNQTLPPGSYPVQIITERPLCAPIDRVNSTMPCDPSLSDLRIPRQYATTTELVDGKAADYVVVRCANVTWQ